MMKVYALSDRGKVRPINEDSFYQPTEGECFCAVADGMGGHNAGEIASSLALETFIATLRSLNGINDRNMIAAVNRANGVVYNESCRDDRKQGMGTTLTALAISENVAHVVHVGDSRAYLLRNGAIVPITTDHSLVEEMILHGEITPKQALKHPMRNVITRAVGTNEQVVADYYRVDLCKGDIFFLCTDGLTNYVADSQIRVLTSTPLRWTEKLRALVQIALNKGGHDNITAMYILTDEEEA